MKLTIEQIQESIALNDEALTIGKSGNLGKVIDLLDQSASFGQPNALASLTWYKMLMNDFQGAIDSYSKYFSRTSDWIDSALIMGDEEAIKKIFMPQLDNIISNVALAYFLDGNTLEARNMCRAALVSKNIEARVIDAQLNSLPLSEVLLKRNDVQTLIETFSSVVEESEQFRQTESALIKSPTNGSFGEFAKEIVAELKAITFEPLPDSMDSEFITENGMSLNDKAKIIVEFTQEYFTSGEYEDFFDYNDLGVPLAIAISGGMVHLTEDGLKTFEDTWESLCETLNADPSETYFGLDEMDFSIHDESDIDADTDADTDYEQLDASVRSGNSTALATETEQWLNVNSIDLKDLGIFNDKNLKYVSKSIFNVETAELFVSNFYPEKCDACEDTRECVVCGKNADTFLTCMTANKDQDFLLIGIQSNEDDPYLGTLIKFYDHTLSTEPDRKGRLKLKMPKVAPVKIGVINIGDEGGLFFGDRTTVADTADFVASAFVSGDQTIVAWVGYDEQGVVTPLALTTTNTQLTKQIQDQVNLDNQPPSEILACIHDSLTGTVFARMGNNAEKVAELNAEMTDKLNGEDLPLGAAWIWQLQIHENLDQFVDELIQNVENPESVTILLFCLDLLRMRGQSNAVTRVLERLTSGRIDLLTSNQLKFIELLRATKVGVFRESNEYSLLEL